MHAATALRLAVVGTRVDGVRVGLTDVGAAATTVALLAALTVIGIGPDDGPYAASVLAQPGLRVGVVVALLGLCVPLLVLLAQCSRIGAPVRDRRLAAIRMAGASPGQIGRIVTAEAALGALTGSVVGTGIFFLLRAVLNGHAYGEYADLAGSSTTVDADGRLLQFPVDVLLPVWEYVAVALAVPLLVGAGTGWASRRVAFTPFGVVHRVRTRPPRVLPLALLIVGVAVFFVVAAALKAGAELPSSVLILIVLVAFVLVAVGLLAGQGALTQAMGRTLIRRTSRPALLIAARRMISDPFAGARATGVLTVAVLTAAGAQRLRQMTIAGQGPGFVDPFYASTYDLVDLVLLVAGILAAAGLLVAAAEGIVARRRTYAAVVAAGTPRRVVAAAVVAELLVPLVPSLVFAAIAGTVAAVGFFGTTVSTYGPVAGGGFQTVGEHTVGVAWLPVLAVLGLGVVVATLTTSLGLVFLRSATDVTELRAAA